MNTENLNALITHYTDQINVIVNDENDDVLKWQGSAYFQQVFDLDSENLADNFEEAIQYMNPLIKRLNGSSKSPAEGIVELMRIRSDEMRSMFKKLFKDDNSDFDGRSQRILEFTSKANAMIDELLDGKSKYKQTYNGVLAYLFAYKPSENYIYKFTEANEFADCMDFPDAVKNGNKFRLENFYQMCDDVLSEINENQDMEQLYQMRYGDDAADMNDEGHMFVCDLIYSASRYNLFDGIEYPKSSRKANSKAMREQEMQEKAEKLQQLKEELVGLEADLAKLQASYNVSDELVLTGKHVVHQKYGEGLITEQNGCKILVDFGGTTKKFVLPGAITGGFLKISDADVNSCAGRLGDLDDQCLHMKKLIARNKMLQKSLQ